MTTFLKLRPAATFPRPADVFPPARPFAADPDLPELKRLIERRLETLLPPAGGRAPRLAAAMRDAALSPGKRLRPLLVLLTAHQCAGDPARALDAACAVEMIHAASLVLDDLPCMDDATLRRGRPAAHLAHGEDIAILAAVALLNLAFGAAASSPDLSDAARGRIVRALSRAVGTDGLAAGQELDLHDSGAGRDMEGALACNRLKTGALIEAAVACGAAAAGADERCEAALARFAGGVGEAFQIRDDLLDMRGSTAEIGKDVGQDAGRATAAALLGPAAARTLIEARLAGACAELAAAPCGAEPLAGFVRKAFGRAAQMVAGAVPAPARQHGEARHALGS